MNSKYDDITFKMKGIAWWCYTTGELSKEKVPNSIRVACLIDNLNGTWWIKADREIGDSLAARIIQTPTWYKREKGGYKRSYERSIFYRKIVDIILPKLLETWETKQSLTPDTRKTFEDIIDEL